VLQVSAKASSMAWSSARVAGWAGLGAEPVLHRLLEPLDLALGLGVVRLAVLLLDPQAA
jgi:hypothetical protein